MNVATNSQAFDIFNEPLVLHRIASFLYIYTRGSRNFRQGGGGGGGGGPGQSDKKALTTIFFFLDLSLFYRSQMVNFKEICHF